MDPNTFTWVRTPGLCTKRIAQHRVVYRIHIVVVVFFFFLKKKRAQHRSRMQNRTFSLHVALVHGAVVWVMCDVMFSAQPLHDDHGDDNNTTTRHHNVKHDDTNEKTSRRQTKNNDNTTKTRRRETTTTQHDVPARTRTETTRHDTTHHPPPTPRHRPTHPPAIRKPIVQLKHNTTRHKKRRAEASLCQDWAIGAPAAFLTSGSRF